MSHIMRLRPQLPRLVHLNVQLSVFSVICASLVRLRKQWHAVHDCRIVPVSTMSHASPANRFSATTFVLVASEPLRRQRIPVTSSSGLARWEFFLYVAVLIFFTAAFASAVARRVPAL